MPNSDDKPQKPQTKSRSNKPLSNSLRLKSPNSTKRKQNVSNILNRLPFLRQLNETQNQLLSVTPIWQKWCSDQIGTSISEFASPAYINQGVLTISCQQPSTATIIKHQQNDLLEAIRSAGIDHVQAVRVQMTLNKPSNSDAARSPDVEPTPQPKNSPQSRNMWPKPSDASVKSLEATQSLIKNEQLAASLKRLADTLKKAT